MNLAEIYATVWTWASEHYNETIYGWDLDLADLIADNIDAEQGDIVEQVREYLENFEDSPEVYGLSIPIYTADLHDIWNNNDAAVEEAIDDFGGLTEMVDDTCGISDVISRGVWYLIDREARMAANSLLDSLDDLEDMLSES